MKYRFNSTYILEHPIDKYSAASIVLDEILFPEEWEKVRDYLEEDGKDRIKQDEERINAADADELLRLMRQSAASVDRHFLLHRLFSMEGAVIGPIKRRVLTTMLDEYIAIATRFLAACTEDVTGWIREQYGHVRSPYMQSMLCLVLGIRGDLSQVPFLFNQVERFEREFGETQYNQGPLLALSELEERFGRF